MSYFLIFLGIVLAAVTCKIQVFSFVAGVVVYAISCICACIGWGIYPDAAWQYGLITTGVFSMVGTGGINALGEFEFYHLGNYAFGVILTILGIVLL